MIINSIICGVVYISIIGFGYLANFVLSAKYKSLSNLFILGFILQTIILQLHYIFLPINLETTYIYLILSVLSFIHFKNFSFINLIKKNKALLIIFLIFFFLLQSTSIQYPTNMNIPDFYGYHKNYINWINSYPATEGLALLNPRHGYAGVTYLNAAYYNFFPYFNKGWAILTPTFILFFFSIFFSALKSIFESRSNKLVLSKIFILLSFYLVFKIILIINKAETSHFLIFVIIALYLFYLLLRQYEKFDEKEILLVIIILIFLPTILFSLSVYSFFVFFIIFLLCYKNRNLFIFKYSIHIMIYSFIIIIPFLYLNFIKSGYFFFPVTFFDSLINLKTIWSVEPNVGTSLIKSANNYSWNKEKDLSIALIANWPPLYLSIILIPIILLQFIFVKKIRPFISLFLFCILMIITWYITAPEQRYGTPYVWTLLFFEITLILYSFNFHFFKINNSTMIILCVLILNASQLIRYHENLNLNFNYKYPGFDYEIYEVVTKDDTDYIISNHEGLLIYDGSNLFVTDDIDNFRLIKTRKKIYFRNLRVK